MNNLERSEGLGNVKQVVSRSPETEKKKKKNAERITLEHLI